MTGPTPSIGAAVDQAERVGDDVDQAVAAGLDWRARTRKLWRLAVDAAVLIVMVEQLWHAAR